MQLAGGRQICLESEDWYAMFGIDAAHLFLWTGSPSMQITVRLQAGDDEEKSFLLSQEFATDVSRLGGVASHALGSTAAAPGKKGDPLTLGTIVITAISGGAISTLITTIGSYLTRDKRTELEISRPDGLKIKISSAKSNFVEIEEALRRLLLAMTGE